MGNRRRYMGPDHNRVDREVVALRSARLLVHSPDGGLASPIALESAAAA